MVAALGQHCLDAVFLPHIAFAQKLDLDAVVRSQPLGVFPQRVAKRLGEPGVVEDPDLTLVQIRGHTLGKADFRECAEKQDPVPAGKYPGDLRRVAFSQQRQAHSSMIIKTTCLVPATPG
jgi:hypothetical protein